MFEYSFIQIYGGTTLPTGATASPPNVVKNYPGTGTTLFSAVAPPAGVDVTCEIWAAGGGGGAGATAGAGAGGGPGSYLLCTIPAALFALGGEVVIGAPGAAGTAGGNGTAATDCTLTADSILQATVEGGRGGAGTGGAPGGPGTITPGGTIVVLAMIFGPSAPGIPEGGNGGAGATGYSPGAGAGGAGSVGTGAAGAGSAPGGGGGGGSTHPEVGAAGGLGAVRFSFPGVA